jgi:hypothetical protein
MSVWCNPSMYMYASMHLMYVSTWVCVRFISWLALRFQVDPFAATADWFMRRHGRVASSDSMEVDCVRMSIHVSKCTHTHTGYHQHAFRYRTSSICIIYIYIYIYIYICIERDIDCQIVLYGTRLKHFLLFTFETPPFIFSQQVGHSTVSFLFGTIS